MTRPPLRARLPQASPSRCQEPAGRASPAQPAPPCPAPTHTPGRKASLCVFVTGKGQATPAPDAKERHTFRAECHRIQTQRAWKATRPAPPPPRWVRAALCVQGDGRAPRLDTCCSPARGASPLCRAAHAALDAGVSPCRGHRPAAVTLTLRPSLHHPGPPRPTRLPPETPSAPATTWGLRHPPCTRGAGV